MPLIRFRNSRSCRNGGSGASGTWVILYSPNDSSSDGRHVKTNKQIHPDESDIRPNENGVKNSYRPGDVSHPVDSSPEASTDTILEHATNNDSESNI